MSNYFINFILYTLSMLGVIFIAFVVVKKSMFSGSFVKQKNEDLLVESFLNLEPRKNLYVVKAGNEKFLISSDPEKTSMLAKLENEDASILNQKSIRKEIKKSYIPEVEKIEKQKNIINNDLSKLSPIRKILSSTEIKKERV